MKSNYLMDISTKSLSINNTPSIQAQRLPFYIHGCGHFYANESYFTEREGLDNYLLIHSISGRGYLKYNDINYNLEPNQSVIFYCGNPHLYRTASQTPWEFKWIHFGGCAVEEYYNIINGDSLKVVSSGDDLQITENLDSIYRTISQDSILTDIKVCSVMTRLLTEIAVSKQSTLNNRNYNQHKSEIDRVLSFIQKNYNEKISTDDLAALVLISKYHFLRLFKTSIGISPYEYLINYRINVSKSLLKTTNNSVTEISFLVGFNDVNNFIRYFKRLVGTTPNCYRKNWIS
ncbi:MAG TPA: AraC family transcriptional regulator [Ruminiclostridium sp.]